MSLQNLITPLPKPYLNVNVNSLNSTGNISAGGILFTSSGNTIFQNYKQVTQSLQVSGINSTVVVVGTFIRVGNLCYCKIPTFLNAASVTSPIFINGLPPDLLPQGNQQNSVFTLNSLDVTVTFSDRRPTYVTIQSPSPQIALFPLNAVPPADAGTYTAGNLVCGWDVDLILCWYL